MQQLASLAVALASLLCTGPVASVSLGEAAARAWLRDHGAPQDDQLAELKAENPEAYGIVKALLTKRSLGLLNPKHPSASFAVPVDANTAATGPEVFQSLAAEGTHHIAPAHGDWLSWKPQDSALNDEEMVKSVLGAVAELKGAKPHKSLLARSQAPPSDSDDQSGEPSLEWKSPSVEAGSIDQAQAEAKPIASHAQDSSYSKGVNFDAVTTDVSPRVAGQENSYLKNINLDDKSPLAAVQPASQENSYLKGIDLDASSSEAPKPKKEVQPDSSNYLASFSWDDESGPRSRNGGGNNDNGVASLRAARAKLAVTKPVPATSEGDSAQSQPASKPAHTDALLSWLGGGAKRASAARAAKPAALPAPENPYMAALQ